MKRTFFAIPLIYALIITFASCKDKNYNCTGSIWATTYHISYTSDRDLGDSIINIMNEVEEQLSMFRPGSTVSRINRNEDIIVGRQFIDVFQLSQKISSVSGGAFDPTVGPLTHLWGFGQNRKDSISYPAQNAIDSALCHIGINDCRIENNKVIKKSPETLFDFSSVAKGFGVDEIARMLKRNGCKNFIVEIGGEIVTNGLNPHGKQWRVMIGAPVADPQSHESMLVIPLSDAAVATSGNYRNFRVADGKRIGHTLDPRTGYPVSTATLSASVIAPDCATADALATACMVLDADEAIEMIKSLPDTEVLLAISSGDTIAIRASSDFPDGI